MQQSYGTGCERCTECTQFPACSGGKPAMVCLLAESILAIDLVTAGPFP